MYVCMYVCRLSWICTTCTGLRILPSLENAKLQGTPVLNLSAVIDSRVRWIIYTFATIRYYVYTVCMYVCMYKFKYLYECLYVYNFVCMNFMYIFIYMYVCMYCTIALSDMIYINWNFNVCMYVCMYVC